MRVARWKLDQLAAPLYKLRAELGLKRGGNPMLEGQHSPRMVLALFSSAIAEPQPDWPPNTRVTGFPFYDRRDRAGDAPGLEPALEEFLERGRAARRLHARLVGDLGRGGFLPESVKARARPWRARAAPDRRGAEPPSRSFARRRRRVRLRALRRTAAARASRRASGRRSVRPRRACARASLRSSSRSATTSSTTARASRASGAGRTLPRSKYNAASAPRENCGRC